MNVALYKTIRRVGCAVFRIVGAPTVLHRERGAGAGVGGCLLAANHTSAFDVPLLIVATPRPIHWLSIVELFRKPWWRWFLNAYGALPLDRSKPDAATTRRVVRLLKGGRMVGLFPEGRFRRGADSVLRGGEFDAGVCGLAQLAGVPILPCVVLGSEQFERWTSWLPLRGTKFAIAYGEPIFPRQDLPKPEARALMQRELRAAFLALHAEVGAG